MCVDLSICVCACMYVAIRIHSKIIGSLCEHSSYFLITLIVLPVVQGSLRSVNLVVLYSWAFMSGWLFLPSVLT